MHCEASIARPGQDPIVVPFDVADGASDAEIQAAANRAVNQRMLASGVVNRDVQFDVYLDTNPASAGNRGAGDSMLFMRNNALVREVRTARPPNTNPLTYRVPWEAGQSLRAKVLNNGNVDTDPTHDGVQSMASLESLSYTTDGQAGPLSHDEALSLVRNFESQFSNDDAGRARLRLVYEQNPTIDLGPDGNSRLTDVYRIAGVTPPGAISRPETGATGGAGPNGTDPNSDPAATSSAIFNHDFSALDANDQRAYRQLRQLIAQLLAGGDPDILLAAIMNVMSKISGNGMARAGVQVADAMQRVQDQIRSNSDRLAGIQSSTSGTGTAGRRDQGDMTRLQTDNQMLTGSLQTLQRVLQSFMEANTEVKEAAKGATDFHQRQSRYMQWG